MVPTSSAKRTVTGSFSAKRAEFQFILAIRASEEERQGGGVANVVGDLLLSLCAGLLVPPRAIRWRRAVQQMVTQPVQDCYGEAGRGAQEGGGHSFWQGASPVASAREPGRLGRPVPFGMRGIGQEDTDALDDDGQRGVPL
jgi:hypothetical protein